MTSTRTARDLLAGLHLNLTQIYRASRTLLADLATDLRYLRSDLATDTRDLYASIRADAADWRDRHAAHRKGLCGTAPTAYQTAAYAIPEWWRCNETRRHYPATAHQTASGGQWGHGPATTEPTSASQDAPPAGPPTRLAWLRQMCAAALLANCGHCWARPGEPCALKDAPARPVHGYHPARFVRAAHRGGLITDTELAELAAITAGRLPGAVLWDNGTATRPPAIPQRAAQPPHGGIPR